MTGEFRMSLDPSEKDALQYVPGASSTANNQPRVSDPRQFDRLQQYVVAIRPPVVRFKDLEAVVTSKLKFNVPLTRRVVSVQEEALTVEQAGQRQAPNGSLEYLVMKSGSNQPVLRVLEEMSALPDASVHQVTV